MRTAAGRQRGPEAGARFHGADHIVGAPRQGDAERHDLVNTGVGRVERPAKTIEPNFPRKGRTQPGDVERG